MLYYVDFDCAFGPVAALSDGKSVVGLWLAGQRSFGAELLSRAEAGEGLPIFDRVRDWVGRYCGGERPSCRELPLAPRGSEFRRTVWELLCEIPYGETVTYGQIARAVGEITHKPRMSAQAVGGAVGHNPISVIIPCHRVVGAGGNLTGYGGGLELKCRLLAHEGVDMSKFYLPKCNENT